MMHAHEWTHRQITPALPTPLLDDVAVVGTTPPHHHPGIGPFLFEPFARHTAERIRARAPKTVLETACCTGIATRRLRDALPRDAVLVASDPDERMLAVAHRTVGITANVGWTRADLCKLQFSDGDFDAVVCQFGLMFAADKLAAVREARRVLRPGGSFLITTWAPLDRNPVVALVDRTLGAMFHSDPPQHAAQAPFGYGDPDMLGDLLFGGGFQDVVVDVVEKATSSPNAHELAAGLIEGYPLIDEIRLSGPARLSAAVSAVAAAIRRQFGDAPVRTRIAALVASAVA
ncbi:MAG TPA: methyltransferase domain-containing protein [Kofleriaceae bacterium]|jgi:SAM-dependent methyltransferase|nr:methyltransferase domain-containing protein [Kofleriaceae bacterium]